MKITMLLAAGLLLAACTATPPTATPDTAGPPADTPGAATPTIEPMPPETFPPFEGDVPQEIMETLIDEVALRGGVGLGEVRIERALAVTWSDASLGCPEEDMLYTQALVDGYWVVLEAGGQTFDFRMGESGLPRLCPEGEGQPPIEGLPD